MTKQDILRATNFGNPVAEEEAEALGSYFVNTHQFSQIQAGQIDVVFGAKGSGKSAIYLYLLKHESLLANQGIRLIAAENVRGTPAFKNLAETPQATEQQLQGVWKLYFLLLIARALREWKIGTPQAKEVLRSLEDLQLLPRESSLGGYLRAALDYVRRNLLPSGVEGGISFDSVTGAPSVKGKILFREPSPGEVSGGHVSVDGLLQLTNEVLSGSRLTVWLLLDRLDAAFADSSDLERGAIRALLRVYRDLRAYDRISLKIFLRDDIWKRVTHAKGFPEASHIIRKTTILWDRQSLLDLLVQRALQNDALRAFFEISNPGAIHDLALKESFFQLMLPTPSPLKGRPHSTFDWMLALTTDGTGRVQPRELIHLLSVARDEEIHRLELGGTETPGKKLLTESSISNAFREVSKTRLEQTLYQEHADMVPWIKRLTGESTQQTPETLARLWGRSTAEALELATALQEAGFFRRMGSNHYPLFEVPPIYAETLRMTAPP